MLSSPRHLPTPLESFAPPTDNMVSTEDKVNMSVFARMLDSMTIADSSDDEEDDEQPTSLITLWRNYFQKGTLADYQRLCMDLGLGEGHLSKTKCRQACHT